MNEAFFINTFQQSGPQLFVYFDRASDYFKRELVQVFLGDYFAIGFHRIIIGGFKSKIIFSKGVWAILSVFEKTYVKSMFSTVSMCFQKER